MRNSANIRRAILALAFLAPFGRIVRGDAPAASPWNVAELQAAPKFEVVAEAKDGLQEILFAGPAYRRDDTPTKVFAY